VWRGCWYALLHRPGWHELMHLGRCARFLEQGHRRQSASIRPKRREVFVRFEPQDVNLRARVVAQPMFEDTPMFRQQRQHEVFVRLEHGEVRSGQAENGDDDHDGKKRKALDLRQRVWRAAPAVFADTVEPFRRSLRVTAAIGSPKASTCTARLMAIIFNSLVGGKATADSGSTT
jgi:hypothetical protein